MRLGSVVMSGVVACLALSCAGPDAPGAGSAPSHSPSAATGSPSQPDAALAPPASRSTGVHPAVPSTQPEAFARELDRAVATLRDRRSAPGELRRAGEFQQLAVRRLASASSAFRRAVLARTRRGTAADLVREVRAASSLALLNAPQKHLPPWRIITPPPMRRLRGYYADAQRLTGVPWTYLAAINLVETRMGRIHGASPAGARGPMQFLPSTWAMYGAGGDINDPRDAILAAARLLRANGAPEDMAGALYHYNPSEHYVRAVTLYARTLQRAPYLYRGYWHWRVLYGDVHGLYVLPEGYPRVHPVLLEHR
jgi:soluble lytic murein transglycosylase-like protein